MLASLTIRRISRSAEALARRARLVLLATVVLAASFSPAIARADDDTPQAYDARVQGYSKEVQLGSSSSGLTYFLMVILGGVCFGVLFMDAKRSHLD